MPTSTRKHSGFKKEVQSVMASSEVQALRQFGLLSSGSIPSSESQAKRSKEESNRIVNDLIIVVLVIGFDKNG